MGCRFKLTTSCPTLIVIFKPPNMASESTGASPSFLDQTNLTKLKTNANLNSSCSPPGPPLPDRLPPPDPPRQETYGEEERQRFRFKLHPCCLSQVFCLKCPLCKPTFARMSAVWRACFWVRLSIRGLWCVVRVIIALGHGLPVCGCLLIRCGCGVASPCCVSSSRTVCSRRCVASRCIIAS